MDVGRAGEGDVAVGSHRDGNVRRAGGVGRVGGVVTVEQPGAGHGNPIEADEVLGRSGDVPGDYFGGDVDRTFADEGGEIKWNCLPLADDLHGSIGGCVSWGELLRAAVPGTELDIRGC